MLFLLIAQYRHLEVPPTLPLETAPSRRSPQSPLSQWLITAASPARAAGTYLSFELDDEELPTDSHLGSAAAPGETPRDLGQATLMRPSSRRWRSARVILVGLLPWEEGPIQTPPSTPKRVVMSRPTRVVRHHLRPAPQQPRPRTTGSGPIILGPHHLRAAGTSSGRTPSLHLLMGLMNAHLLWRPPLSE